MASTSTPPPTSTAASPGAGASSSAATASRSAASATAAKGPNSNPNSNPNSSPSSSPSSSSSSSSKSKSKDKDKSKGKSSGLGPGRTTCTSPGCKAQVRGRARFCPLHAGPAREFITKDVRASLGTVSFDMFAFSKDELVYLFEAMFEDAGLVDAFELEEGPLLGFLNAVKRNYNDNPFHNFYHGFTVTQMVYNVLVACAPLPQFLTPLERFALLFAATCHDLDHDGVNNAYHVNSRSELATLYNDQSCLENHHCSQAFRILGRPQCNIVAAFDSDTYKRFRKIVIGCILSTDMGKHFEILGRFDKLIHSLKLMSSASLPTIGGGGSVGNIAKAEAQAPTDDFDWDSDDHRALLAQIILMCADISNEARPFSVSRKWADRLVEEFGNQVDREKAQGLPFMPFMDRDQVVLEKSQVGFIAFLLRPLWVSAAVLLPPLAAFIDEIDDNYQAWSVMVQRNVSADMLRRLSEADPTFTEQVVPPGTVLCRLGEASDELFFVHEGDVCVVDENFDRVLNTFPTGCFFGEIALLKGVPRTANVIAKTQARIHIAPKAAVTALIDEEPDFRKTLEQVARVREGVIYRNIEKGLQSIGLDNVDMDHLVHLGGG